MEPRDVSGRMAAEVIWVNADGETNTYVAPEEIWTTSSGVSNMTFTYWDVDALSAPIVSAQDIYYATVGKDYCDASSVGAELESSENMGTELSWEQMMSGIANKNQRR